LWLRQNSSAVVTLIVHCGSFCSQERYFSWNLQLQVFLRLIFLLEHCNCGAAFIGNLTKKKILLVSNGSCGLHRHILRYAFFVCPFQKLWVGGL
jgi:hypothetical protein